MLNMNPKEEKFFDLFEKSAKVTYETSIMLQELLNNFDSRDEKVKNIKEKEHEADQVQHEILRQLNLSFITPFDREDIYSIAKKMDDIVDFIDATACRFTMFDIKETNEYARRMGDLIVECSKQIITLMEQVRIMRKSKNLKDLIIEINRLEEEGDAAFRDAITNLFTSKSDVMNVIKWREIYDYFENTLDACEDVANIVEGVVMKNA